MEEMTDDHLRAIADDLLYTVMQYSEDRGLPPRWTAAEQRSAEILSMVERKYAGRGGPATSIEALRASRLLAALLAGGRQDLVEQARAEGASWSEIGRALGLTKQAVQQAYRRVHT